MPDSVVNVSSASSIAFPVPKVYFAPAGALEVSGRILSGESRSETSQARVGCGLQGRPPAGIVHEARESAQGTSACFHLPTSLSKKVKQKSRFAPLLAKKVYYGGSPGLESGEIVFETNSSLRPRSFSRTIPVRTPQSASRTEKWTAGASQLSRPSQDSPSEPS